jgi:hypothetical protein
MQQVAVLFGPIIEVRDVLESFLNDGVLVPEWRRRLVDASCQFVELSQNADDGAQVVQLASEIAELAVSDLATSPLTRSLAAEIERLMGEVRLPGLLRSEAEDWAF